MTRTRPTQLDLDQMLDGKRGEVKDAVFRHVAGLLPPEEFGRELRQILLRGHAMAGYLGRRRAGDMAPYDQDDTTFGQMLTAEQQPFLDGFVADLDADRYEGEDGRPMALPILRRAEMYVDRMRGSANEAFVLASGPTALYWWRLGDAEACPDCPRMEAGNPWNAGTLAGRFPASGWSACGVNCRCSLWRDDGVSGFR
jgi:hypothetical protein